MKKILLYIIGLYIVYRVIMAIVHDPTGSAATTKDTISGADNVGNSFFTFFTSLGGEALAVVVIVGVAIYFAKKK